MNKLIKLDHTIFLLIKQIKNSIKKKILAAWSFEQCQLKFFLVDEAVVDDGAADLLVELKERLHLVHREASGLVGEACELAEVGGGPSTRSGAA
uniref:Uncharacterized protein n=1 Tax=Zea mays TaxID=4577 RepID=C0PKW3_MAIZE|nr:unknown [Zea mays]